MHVRLRQNFRSVRFGHMQTVTIYLGPYVGQTYVGQAVSDQLHPQNIRGTDDTR